jgi:hypothetical protein
MPWSGGNYTLPSNSFNPSVSGTAISSSDWNDTAADLEAGLSDAINKDGQSTTTAAIPFAQGIKLGAGTDVLAIYDEGTWTPAVTYTTPGTSSTSYSTQTGTYTRIGNRVFLEFALVFTPTLGTATGDFRITGIPFTAANANVGAGMKQVGARFSMPAGYTQYGVVLASTTQIGLHVFGSASASGAIGPANMTDAQIHTLAASLCYAV